MFWNGTNWIDEHAPTQATIEAGASRKRNWFITALMLSVLIVLPIVPLAQTSASSPAIRSLTREWSRANVVRTFQENHDRVKFEGTWKRTNNGDFLKGRARSSRDAGARFSFAFNGTAVSWIGPMGPNQGKARVYLDDRLIRTVDTYAPEFLASRVLFKTTWKALKVRTLTVEVVGTKGRPTVTIDALIMRGKEIEESLTVSAAKVGSQGPAGRINPRAPVISALVTSNVQATEATVSWALNKAATGQVEYGVTTKYGSQSAKESSFDWTYHIQTLRSLVPGTVYHYRVRSADAGGNLSISADQTFTTVGLAPAPDPTAAPTPATNAAPAPTAQATAAPSNQPDPALVSSGMYGLGVATDTLANTTTDQGPVSYRFVADRDATLAGVRVYFEIGSGYSGGDGGSRQITLESDDAGRPSGTILATNVHNGLPSGASRFVTFALAANLRAGEAYHVVFTNSGAGFISANALYVRHSESAPIQPRYAGWQVLRNGVVRDRFLPILELHWSDGATSGIGYMGTSQRGPENQARIGGPYRVREVFAPQRDVTFTEVWVRLKRDPAGNLAALTVSLGGRTGAIAAAEFPIGTQTDDQGNRNAWSKIVVPPTTLGAGEQHALELSAPTGQVFRAQFVQKGSGYGFSSFFRDGHAERSIDGSAWTMPLAFDSPTTSVDLQWFVR